MSLFIPITKVDVAKRLVYGTLTEEVPDKAGEILDYESAKPAFQDWSNQFQEASGGKSLGNVRAMHGSVAAGKFTDISFDDEHKRINGVAKIVDDDEWQKVLEGVYTGFSIGGGYARRWPDSEQPELMRYTPVLSEVSLVDNPAVPTATFEVVKQDGSVELRKFNFNNEGFVKHSAAIVSPAPDDAETHIANLLKELSWLMQSIKGEDDPELEEHIAALQDYLDGEGDEQDSDDDDADEDNEGPEVEKFYDGDMDDDTSSHAYAAELARLSRRAVVKSEAREARNEGYLMKQIADLQKRIVQLESQPLPVKGVLRAVSKSDDMFSVDSISVAESLAKMTQAERAVELMKIALRNPVEM